MKKEFIVGTIIVAVITGVLLLLKCNCNGEDEVEETQCPDYVGEE